MADYKTQLLEARTATQNLLSIFKPEKGEALEDFKTQEGEAYIDQIKGNLDKMIDVLGVLSQTVRHIRDALPAPSRPFQHGMQRAKIDPPSELSPGDK